MVTGTSTGTVAAAYEPASRSPSMCGWKLLAAVVPACGARAKTSVTGAGVTSGIGIGVGTGVGVGVAGGGTTRGGGWGGVTGRGCAAGNWTVENIGIKSGAESAARTALPLKPTQTPKAPTDRRSVMGVVPGSPYLAQGRPVASAPAATPSVGKPAKPD
jgi:hypothetical protein